MDLLLLAVIDVLHRKTEESSQVDVVKVGIELLVVHLGVEDLTKVVTVVKGIIASFNDGVGQFFREECKWNT